jgi:hypothetical protein
MSTISLHALKLDIKQASRERCVEILERLKVTTVLDEKEKECLRDRIRARLNCIDFDEGLEFGASTTVC